MKRTILIGVAAGATVGFLGSLPVHGVGWQLFWMVFWAIAFSAALVHDEKARLKR